MLLDIFSSISSSSSSLISGVIALLVRLFFAFPFDASASTSLTSLRISYILKTNFPSIATHFPFLRSLRICSNSLNLAFSFYRKAFLDVILSKATPNCLIYYFIGVLRVEEQTIVLTSNVASYSSVPSGSELSSREQSRSFGVVIGGRVVGGGEVDI